MPNSVLAKDTITNYSEPTHDTRVEVEVGASYDTPPNEVKAAILDAIRDEPLLARDRQSDVLVADFARYAITYRVRVWTTDFAADMRVRDRVRSHIYYAFRRHGISIPYPIQVQMNREWTESAVIAARRAPRWAAQIFRRSTDAQRTDARRRGRASTAAAKRSCAKATREARCSSSSAAKRW